MDSKNSFYPTHNATVPTAPQQYPQQNNASQNQSPRPIFVTSSTSQFGENPVEMDCPYCSQHIITHIERIAGLMPWLIGGACCFLGIFLIIPLCLSCIPFCINSCLDVIHSCPACKRHLGRFKRIS